MVQAPEEKTAAIITQRLPLWPVVMSRRAVLPVSALPRLFQLKRYQ
jgi:hypothetical protein